MSCVEELYPNPVLVLKWGLLIGVTVKAGRVDKVMTL